MGIGKLRFESFARPCHWGNEHFYLRPLEVADLEEDYAAFMEDPAWLREWRGTEWPSDDFSLLDSLHDLRMHKKEAIDNEGFAYTVVTPSGHFCLGCVYFYPLCLGGPWRGLTRHAIVHFWTRKSMLLGGLDEILLDGLLEWIRQDWPLGEVWFCTGEKNKHQQSSFVSRGLTPGTIQGNPSWEGNHLVFGKVSGRGG